ncbi:hypothetical protein QJ857_gp0407 [Tupanvirus soda lake]|uniref:Uncharacterized protein n=2 Tax=Tupanvirus TaxID=2094720 RepID=A0A6N1NT81_9VIRU|nr:hypothetical protein QJ857_gp0407 [Tupanvirus soda lake]QKU35627.1 hypothetical protein [Tupanvirus soda lake]
MKTPQLITILNDLTNAKYIKKDVKIFVKDNLEQLKEYTDDQETKQIDTVIKMVSKQELKAEDRRRFKQLRQSVVNVVKKYEEEFNEEPNEDYIDNNLSVDEIEKKLDEKIPQYNGFDENHPMKGVICSSKNLWRFNLGKIDKTNKNKNTMIQYAKEYLIPENSDNFGKLRDKKYFCYHNHYFVCYWKDNEPYFDIQHIISVLNLKKSSWNDKYNEFSDKIEYYYWHKNEYDGYILRELIGEKTVYELILSSNSDLSKSFKKDVAKILAQLRSEGKLDVTNEKITIKKKGMSGMNTENYEKLKQTLNYYVCSYDSPNDVMYAQHLISKGSKFPISKYLNKHVLYAFIIPTKTQHNDIIIKFGYSEDITDRFHSLKTEYKSNVFFLGARLITGKKDENIFHNALKTKYADLIEKYSIKDKNKIELYKLSPVLMEEFNNYSDLEEPEDEPTKLEKEELEIMEILKNQEELFCKETMPSYLGKVDNQFLITKEKNLHERLMKEKEMELAKLKYQHIDKEIELTKAQAELAKAQAELEEIRSKNNKHIKIKSPKK